VFNPLRQHQPSLLSDSAGKPVPYEGCPPKLRKERRRTGRDLFK
jgi:hypothetical protein